MGNIQSAASQCDATITGDPDIAGPGVVAAFLITGWLTFAIAAIVGVQKAVVDYRALIERNAKRKLSTDIEMQDQSETATPDRSVLFRWSEVAQAFLAPLCDLQVATGTAMLVAGFAQGSKLTYYHELIIVSYWNITLNSFWAAQLGNPKYEEIKDLASRVRNVAVLGSTVLSIIFQVRFNNHIFSHWQQDTPGKCYILNHDGSGRRQANMWVCGLSIYAAVLAARILGLPDKFLDRISFEEVDQKILDHFQKKEKDKGIVTPVFEVLCRALAWLLTSFLVVWSFGSGSFGIETLAILGYLSWNTLDVIDAKVSNLLLVDPPEASWGFGQVLPMILLGTILFGALDVLKMEKKSSA